MKIIFIEPCVSEANVYSKLHMPLLGPVYLATILKNRGHEVEIYNENIFAPDYSNLDADLIGISILTITAKRGFEIARRFAKDKVIIGGSHATLLPHETLQFARQVVAGEAEDVICDVAEGRNTASIVYGKPVKDLDALPNPDFSLIKGFKPPYNIIPISTSRGCPFDCIFCTVTKVFGREYRFRSAKNIMEEVKSINAKAIFFCDDNFAAHPKRTKNLMNLFIQNKINRWICQVRCDVAKDRRLLDLMAEAGCKVVCVGFESINPKTLNAYKKNQSLEDIITAIRSFRKRKISIHGMFVLGGDDDDKKTIWDTVRFAIKQKITTIQLNILTPVPSTKFYDTLEAQNRIFTKDWDFYDGMHIVFKPKLLSAKELQVNVVKAYAKFYSKYRFLSLLLKLRLRDAFCCLVGHTIVKEWISHNRDRAWLK